MNDLSEPIYSIVESVVKTVHENQYLVSPSLFGHGSDRRPKGFFVQVIGGHRHKISPGVSRKRCRPLNFPDLPGAVETVIAAYETPAARPPLNISPGSVV